jgi:FkbM family methyltransferase
MLSLLLKVVKAFFASLNLHLSKKSTWLARESLIKSLGIEIHRIRFIELVKTSGLPDGFQHFLQQNLSFSNSQMNQDLLALYLFSGESGFFCEVGGGDGITYSNTKILEDRGWQGVIVEPSKKNILKIRKSRKAKLVTKLAWSKSAEYLTFVETKNLELSTIDTLVTSDNNAPDRSDVLSIYKVETITLTQIFEEAHAPARPEYLSLDTEGSELEILRGLDFDRFTPLLISCEHNFTPQRDLILELLTLKGYTRIFVDFSRHDDWYLLETFANSLEVNVLNRI